MAKRFASSSSPSPSSAVKRARSSEFQLGIRDLNSAFLTSLQAALSKNQGCVLVPLVKDYLEYSRTLLENSSGVALSGSSSLAELGVFFDEFERNFIKTSSKEEGMETEEDGNNNKVAHSAIVLSSSSSSSGYLSTVPEDEEQQQTTKVPSQHLKRRLVEATRPPNPDQFAARSGFPTALFLIHAPSPGDVGDRGGHRSAIQFGAPPPSSGGFIGFGLPPPSSGASPTVLNGRDDSPNEAAQEEDEENEEPPQNEVVPVIEDDSVYSIKCKVFGMTDNQYKDKGKGTLYIKMLSEGKFQLVVRADNNLGTLLLNILLNKGLPLDKKSAKDVMTFDVMGNNGKGMPILLRVKDEDAANELISQLKEFQRQSAK